MVHVLVKVDHLLHGPCFSVTFVVAMGGRLVDAFVGAPSHYWTHLFGFDSNIDKLEYKFFLYKIGFSSLTWLIDKASGEGCCNFM